MKSKLLFVCCLCAVLLAAASARAGVVGIPVYALSLSGNGQLEDTTTEPPSIFKLKVTQNDLLNLAIGQFPGSLIPTNLVLAWTQECLDTDFRIVVWDTEAEEVVEEVARVVDAAATVSNGKGTFVMAMELRDTNGEFNSINGGTLAISGKFTELGDCPDGISGSVFGILHVKFTTDLGTFDVDIVVPKGKLSVGDQIGTLIP